MSIEQEESVDVGPLTGRDLLIEVAVTLQGIIEVLDMTQGSNTPILFTGRARTRIRETAFATFKAIVQQLESPDGGASFTAGSEVGHAWSFGPFAAKKKSK